MFKTKEAKKTKSVDGQNMIYHYLQKYILKEENEFSKQLIEKLIVDLSIWLPIEFYKELPIIFPYVLRDATCRKANNPEGIEEWGSPNSKGFFRDDNTLIKGIGENFIIESPRIYEYNNAKKGKGFTASHIWREISINGSQQFASNHYRTYSFVPNLVWLPTQISKLTDREGSYAQLLLQTISHQIYNDTSLKMDIAIDEIWKSLPNPGIPLEFEKNLLNYYKVPEEWLRKQKRTLLKELNIIQSVLENKEFELKKVKCSRYLPGLIKVSPENKQDLLDWLILYQETLLIK